MRPRLSIILAGAWVTICAGLQLGCVQYATPGAGMRPVNLAAAEEDIAARLERRAAAPFPARLAIARVQAPGYRSHSAEGYGRGKFSVVTVRDVETGKDFERLSSLPLVAGVAPLNRLILPEQLNSDKELRLAAAALHTDILLLYSFDTNFRIDGRDIGPLGLITLGFLPVDEAVVTSTVSAALFDVRTGFVFGVAEGSATQKQPASAWNTRDAIDDARRKAERKSFDNLLDELEQTWKHVVGNHAGPQPVVTASRP